MSKKLVVYGLPLNPAHLLDELEGGSFCVSYYSRHKVGNQMYQALDLCHEDGIFLLDNGAFSHWMKGGSSPDFEYWKDFGRWASGIMSYSEQVVAVIPDVIGGDEDTNRRLCTRFCEWAKNRGGNIALTEQLMPVWHMHESFDYLRWMCQRFKYVAIGSSGQYAKVGTPKWHARIRKTFRKLRRIQNEGYELPHVHMMRAQSMLHMYPFDSADSCNVAINHNQWGRRNGMHRHVGRMAETITTRVDSSCNGIPNHEPPGLLRDNALKDKFKKLTERLGISDHPLAQ